MMAVRHALSGLAAEAALVALAGVVTVGGALLPDLDHPNATACRSLGWLGPLVCRVLRAAAGANAPAAWPSTR